MTSTVKLHYEERGSGQPVVLLHGFPLDRSIWDAQVEALSESYRVITPDLRGHGHSPVTGGVYEMDLLARDVLGLLDDLGIERAVWVGHSMGGYVTMAALRIAPERIGGVGLVGTHPHADAPEKRLQRIQSATLVAQDGVGDVALSMMSVLFAPSLDRQSTLAQNVYRIMMSTAPEAVAGSQRGMADRPDSVATLRGLAKPAAVIVGEKDALVATDTAQAMADLIPGARCVVIADAGHMAMLEQPGPTTAALRDLVVLTV